MPSSCLDWKYPSCALAALCLFPSLASAQQPIALPGITVQSATIQARPVQSPASAAAAALSPGAVELTPDAVDGIPLDRVGSSVSVVTREQLERQQIRHAADALRSLPGVSVSQQGTPGNVTNIRIRGAESKHTLVLIDGIEVNSPTDGAFDFSNVGVADIERIEVLRGPQSGLYGGGAIGGVISITTKSGRGPLTASVKGEVGSRSTSAVTGQVSGGNDAVWGALVVHGFNTAGYNISFDGNETDGSRIKSFALRGGVRLFEGFKVEGTLREHNNRSDYDNGNFPAGDRNGLFVINDAPFFGDTRLRVGNLTATWETLNKTWIHKFQLGGAETVRDDYDPLHRKTIATNSKYGYTSTLRLDGPAGTPVRHFLTGLVEQRSETFQQPTAAPTKFGTDRTSFAGELRGEYFNSLFLSGTVRRDDNDTFDDFTTWHAAASLKVPGSIFRLHASIGTGVKYPNFGDLFGIFGAFQANPNLQPEQSKGYDFGLETSLVDGKLVIDVTRFNANLTNEITTSFAPVPPFTATPINRPGESTRAGIEIAARYQVTKQLAVGGAYTFLDARDDLDREEIRRPRNAGRIDLAYGFLGGRGTIDVAAIYNGRMQDIVFPLGFPDPRDRITLDDYWLVNVSASYKVLPGVELFGRMQNVLDQHYQEVFGYNATAGATAFAGVKLTFGGPEGVGGRWAK